MEGKKVKLGKEMISFNIIGYTVVILLAILCVLPIWLIIAGSFSNNKEILIHGYSFLPRDFSLTAYVSVFEKPMQMLNAYKTSIIVTIFGTLICLLVSSSSGYVLSRKDFKYRNIFSFYFFFTTIFSAGLVPYYMMCVNLLKFKEHPYVAMVLPGAFGFFYAIIFRSFMSDIPASLGESAKLDGANDIQIFWKIILPLSKPVMATVGLFSALGHWGDWYHAMLFVSDSEKYPLQYYLFMVINRAKALAEMGVDAGVDIAELPTETYKLAVTVVTTGPIILVYPFVQKYFIKGMTVGAVKG